MIDSLKKMREIILTDLAPQNPGLARSLLLKMYVLILTSLREKSALKKTDSVKLKPLGVWIGRDKEFLELLQALEKDIDSLRLNKKPHQ